MSLFLSAGILSNGITGQVQIYLPDLKLASKGIQTESQAIKVHLAKRRLCCFLIHRGHTNVLFSPGDFICVDITGMKSLTAFSNIHPDECMLLLHAKIYF